VQPAHKRGAHTASVGEQTKPAAAGASGAKRFKRLPERIEPEDMVESQPTAPPRDPEGGRDTDRDFMIRYGGGG